MKRIKRVIGILLSLIMLAGLISSNVTVMAEDAVSGEKGVSVGLGDLLEVSANSGEKNLMSLYKDGIYEGKVSLNGVGDTDTYQIFVNGELILEGTIQGGEAGDCWIRYSALDNTVLTQYEDGFAFPATWVGGFSGVTKSSGEKYLEFQDWSPSDTNANLDYAGGGVFCKTFTFDEMQSEQSMEYKIAFGGDWDHGSVPGNNKQLTFPVGTTKIDLWVNTLTSETYDSVSDKDAVTMDTVKITVNGNDYAMIQTGANTFMRTVRLEAGTYMWTYQIGGQEEVSGDSVVLDTAAAVTFLYDSTTNAMLNSAADADALAAAINYPISEEDDVLEEPEVELKDVSFGDLLQISINGGQKCLMSPYYNGMFEAEVELRSGSNTYRIFLNGKLAKTGYLKARETGTSWVRYFSFQDKVLTPYDDSDGFKFPATWVGDFSSVVKEDGSKYLSFGDWSPNDTNADLNYVGGGVFRKAFTFDEMQSEQSMEYKIAFGGDWNHGSVPGSNKQLTFPVGTTEIDLWVNTLTGETFDSVSDRDTVTMDTVAITVGGNDYAMIQTGANTFMETVWLEAGTHSWIYQRGEQQSAQGGSVTLSAATAVTFLYNSKDGQWLNSVDDADELESVNNWVNTLNAAYDTYDGNDLGAVYSQESTTFKVWAPSASSVVLNRYAKGSSNESGDSVLGRIPMEKALGTDGRWSNGIWQVTVAGDLKNTYYTYSITAGGATKETNDIYAKAAGLNGERGMVVDLDATDPNGWEQDAHVMVDKPTDAVVWEVNVRDFSSDDSSGMRYKGKFLAFTEEGTTVHGKGDLATGIDYLKELGVNYVQLLPVFDYVNDETDYSNEGYNWGYSPLNYNVPEGLYSTNPYDGNVRINEFKQMVKTLHDNGIGVVMDVVFNHVGGDAKESYLNRTVPGYYFRQDEWGNFLDSGTACGNETASEAEMFRKYMIDSVVYWASEYHIDGFRFDLMGCHDVETMNQLRAALDELPGGEKILTYGEPWAAGTTNQPDGVLMVSQATMTELNPRIGAFNDYIRDSLKGRVFDDHSTGFLQSGNYTEQPESCPVYTDEDTIAALQGNTNDAYPNRWASQPSQVVSYVSAHDNLGLYDKLQYSVNSITEAGDVRYYERDENLVKMNKMAAAAVAVSPGTVFFQAGEEMARSKGGVENSYESPLYFEDTGKELNQINWERSEEFSDLLEYYRGLLKLRQEYAPFRAEDMTTVNNMTFSDDAVNNLVAYTIASPGAKWDMVAVLMNSNTTAQEVTLKAADGEELPTIWNCVVNQSSAGIETLATYQGTTITVPAQTVLVLAAADKGGNENVTPPAADKSGNENLALPTADGGNKAGIPIKPAGAVKTGDTTNIFLPIAIMTSALLVILCTVVMKKRYRKNKGR